MENKTLNHQRQLLSKKINSYFSIPDKKNYTFIKKDINKKNGLVNSDSSCGACSRKYYGK
jgi:hypothetical protein